MAAAEPVGAVGTGLRSLLRLRGLLRSLALYYLPPGRGRRMDAFYGGLVGQGDLCFDIGAHAGNRTASWLRLGARVVALEPQPDFARLLRLLFGRRSGVAVVEAAVAREPGNVELAVSLATPTVSSGSSDFIAASRAIPSFAAVRWGERVRVPAVTLDQLIRRHGRPDFVKIDVEGMESEVLAGLGQAVALLSFEFLAAAPASATACFDRLAALGDYRFNLSVGESLQLVFEDWQSRAAVEAWLAARAGQDFSGDVYARLVAPALPAAGPDLKARRTCSSPRP